MRSEQVFSVQGDAELIARAGHLFESGAKKALREIYNAEDVRHEALYDRMGVKDLCRRAVAAARQKLGAA